MSEKAIQNEIMRALGQDPRCIIWRANVGYAVPMHTVKAALTMMKSGQFAGAIKLLEKAQPIAFGLPGQADITGILANGRRLEVEVKTDTGRVSPEQTIFARNMARMNAAHGVARSAADALAILEEGLKS